MSKVFVRNASAWVPMPMQTAPPGCSVSSNGSSSQVAASNALTRVNFDGAEYRDTNGYHSSASNPSKITVPNISSLSGLYTLSARVEFGYYESGVGFRIIGYMVNNTNAQWVQSCPSDPTGPTRVSFTEEIYLAANDFLEIIVFNTAPGGNYINAGKASITWAATS